MIKYLQKGDIGFDCNDPLDYQTASQFKEAGFNFAIRYVSLSQDLAEGDLTKEEVQNILNTGLGLLVVQHVPYSGWSPTAEKGQLYGKRAAEHCYNAGIPAGVCVYLDLEGVLEGQNTSDIIDYCNRWYDAVKQYGYIPGIYVGANSYLTGEDLYFELSFQHYWKSMSAVPDVEYRGYEMAQFASDPFNGIPIDRNTILGDNLGNYPAAYFADEEVIEPDPCSPSGCEGCETLRKYNQILGILGVGK
jgi:hypothetical protein